MQMKNYNTMKIKVFLSCLMGVLLLASCSSYTEQETDPIPFEIVFEGPLFEGPNEANAEIRFNASDFGVEKEQIKSVRLKNIEVRTDEEDGFSNFESMLFNFYSNDISMTNVAAISPVPNESVIQPNPMKDTEFDNFSKVDLFYLVLDANFTEEYYDDFIVKGEMVLTLKVKE